ncbi:unnamed protein product (macronuclear) [Paramecium tetraurelia]|uniref:Transmembrane protein n=1 Tax=Paramecium tetraurelia TaxID=5888 RepID=A0DV91_PARTE|nr:uncharacterized protein GSPATT00020622001 [Paramecium tetraurelia]CAK86958.1 unnamed protein product [Paramecium tetraurelia]|eukprot:XP_001454355.1 hypothetical protein (macronuclear) [Paramecium tetraurelia strain d4-2]
METERFNNNDSLIKFKDAQISPFFWKSQIVFDEEHPEYTLNQLLGFLLKMIYVQAINLIFVYIIAFLTFYLGGLQNFLVERDDGIIYTLYWFILVIIFYIAICAKKLRTSFKLVVYIVLSLMVILLFGNLLGLMALYFPYEQRVIFLIYPILLTSTMIVSFITILKVVPIQNFSFEKLVATSTLAQLIIFIIFICLFNEEWLFIVFVWLYHYLYCVCFTYHLIQISTGTNNAFKGDQNIPLDYMIAGLTIYIGSVCFTLSFVPILTFILILESFLIMCCKTDERYFDIV